MIQGISSSPVNTSSVSTRILSYSKCGTSQSDTMTSASDNSCCSSFLYPFVKFYEGIIWVLSKIFYCCWPAKAMDVETFFKSEEKVQQIFEFDGVKVGIIFNPNGKARSTGNFTISDHIALISEKKIPQKAMDKIDKFKRNEDTYSVVSMPTAFNGQPTLKYFGF